MGHPADLLIEGAFLCFAVTTRTRAEWQGKKDGSRFRANAHISKSRYGAPDFVANQMWATLPIKIG
jgi:hypothetical protein